MGPRAGTALELIGVYDRLLAAGGGRCFSRCTTCARSCRFCRWAARPRGCSGTCTSAWARVGVFALHVGPQWPQRYTGRRRWRRFICSRLTSGLVGLYLTRTIPAQLARVGEEVILRADSGISPAGAPAGARAWCSSRSPRRGDDAGRFLRRRGCTSFFERPRGLRYLLRPTTARAAVADARDAGPPPLSVGSGTGGVREAVRAGAAEGRSRFSRSPATAA